MYKASAIKFVTNFNYVQKYTGKKVFKKSCMEPTSEDNGANHALPWDFVLPETE